MSIRLVKQEIERFLMSDVPEVLCIYGGWGVGKSYVWNSIYQQCSKKGKIALQRYAYISLFGEQDVQTLQQKIVLSLEDTLVQKADKFQGAIKTFRARYLDIEDSLKELAGKKITAIGGIFEHLYVNSVREFIVCIDDIERRSSSISMSDLLGVASNLRDQKHCKVVLILNKEKLPSADKDDLSSQFEKVIDSHLEFTLSPDEALDIAVKIDTDLMCKFRDICSRLAINNIRILKKAERIVRQLDHLIKGLSDGIVRDVISCVCLSSVIKYKYAIDDLSILKSLNFYYSSEDDDGKPWLAECRSIGYMSSDDVDICIIDGVQKGYLDFSLLGEVLREKQERLSNRISDDRFSLAWKNYHNFLDQKPEAIAAEMLDAIRKEAAAISPNNLNGTVRMLRDIGMDQSADEAIEIYFASPHTTKELFEGDVFFGRDDPVDPVLSGKLDELLSLYVDARDPKEVFDRLIATDGWNEEDIALLSNLDSETLECILKQYQGEKLFACLKFLGRFVNSTTYSKFSENISIMAHRIAKRSPVNARKMRDHRLLGHGKPIDPNPESP
jgi:hypothetical protein